MVRVRLFADRWHAEQRKSAHNRSDHREVLCAVLWDRFHLNDSKQCPTTTCQCSFFCSKQWLLWLPVVTSLQANVTEALKVVFLENKLLCRSHLPTLSFRITDQLYWSEREYASMNSNMTLTKPFSCQYLTNINGIVFPHQGSATGFSLNPTRTPSPPRAKKKKKKSITTTHLSFLMCS